jgi:hypothetical protein
MLWRERREGVEGDWRRGERWRMGGGCWRGRQGAKPIDGGEGGRTLDPTRSIVVVSGT